MLNGNRNTILGKWHTQSCLNSHCDGRGFSINIPIIFLLMFLDFIIWMHGWMNVKTFIETISEN